MLRLLITLVLGLVCAGPVLANDLGEVSVPMPNGTQGDDVRQAALQQGLERVIARLTGQNPSQVDGVPGVAQALKEPDKWLLRYGYESAGKQGEPPQLKATFDADALADYLAGQGASVWSGPRPSILVWLVDEGNGQGRMVGAGDELATTVNQDAADQGLQVTLPKWDDQDRNTLSVSDIRGHFDDPLMDASQRYGSNWVATGVIYGGRHPTINWRLLNDGDTVTEKRDRVDSKDDALKAMMVGIGKTLADRYRVSGGGAGRQDWVTVRGVNSLKAWEDLKQRMVALGAVSAVGLRQADGDQLSLSVDFAGSRTQLARALGSLPALRPCAAPNGADGAAQSPPRSTAGVVGSSSGSAGSDAGAAGVAMPITFCER